MSNGSQHIERIVVIAARRWRRPLGSLRNVTSLPAIDLVPSFDPPSTGGFASRQERGRYHAHLEALRQVQSSGAATAVICEGVVPPVGVLGQIDRLVGALPLGWSVEFLDHRTGRRRRTATPRLYVVSALGAHLVHDHLEAVLNGPREESLDWGALQRALQGAVPTELSISC